MNEREIASKLREAETRCASKGLRFTDVRRKVLDRLMHHEKGVKAYELLDEMREVHPGSTPPTVYRALDFLVGAGLVHRLDSQNAFIVCNGHHRKHGFLIVCPSCHAVAEFDDPETSHALSDRIAQAGFLLEHPLIEVKALCPDCQALDTEDLPECCKH